MSKNAIVVTIMLIGAHALPTLDERPARHLGAPIGPDHGEQTLAHSQFSSEGPGYAQLTSVAGCPSAATVAETPLADRWAVWDAKSEDTGCHLNQDAGECGGNAPCSVWKLNSRHFEARSSADEWPHKGRIAVIIRGQAFRTAWREGESGMRGLCDESTEAPQLEAAHSLVEHVFEPLEAFGNQLDLFVTEGSNCSLTAKLLAAYSTHASTRVISSDVTTPSAGQADDVRRSLNLFKKQVAVSIMADADSPQRESERLRRATTTPRGRQEERNASKTGFDAYDLVLFTRHEIRWKQNITEADAVRPAKFNFMCRCEEGTGVGPSCTADHFMMLPGKFFKSFDAAVGQPDCFEHDPDHPEKDLTASGEPTQQWGHGCSQYLAEWLPADSIAYLTEWRPESFMREPGNPVGELQ